MTTKTPTLVNVEMSSSRTLRVVHNAPSTYALGFFEWHFAFDSEPTETVPPLYDLLMADPVACDAVLPLFTELLGEVQNSHVKFLLRPHPSMDASIAATALVPINDDEHPDRLQAMRGVTESCMSCTTSTPLWAGLNRAHPPSDPVLAQLTSADCIVASTEHTNVWVDAKGRKVLIVTPKRHVERVSELEPNEWRDLWQTLLRFAERASVAIVNHGSMQNHAHLHFKLFFDRRRDLPAECVERVDLCGRLYKALKNRRRDYSGADRRAKKDGDDGDESGDDEE